MHYQSEQSSSTPQRVVLLGAAIAQEIQSGKRPETMVMSVLDRAKRAIEKTSNIHPDLCNIAGSRLIERNRVASTGNRGRVETISGSPATVVLVVC